MLLLVRLDVPISKEFVLSVPLLVDVERKLSLLNR